MQASTHSFWLQGDFDVLPPRASETPRWHAQCASAVFYEHFWSVLMADVKMRIRKLSGDDVKMSEVAAVASAVLDRHATLQGRDLAMRAFREVFKDEYAGALPGVTDAFLPLVYDAVKTVVADATGASPAPKRGKFPGGGAVPMWPL